MRWQEEYKKKLVSAEEAAKAVKSGDTVVIPYRTNTQVIPQAIANRRNQLRNVHIIVGTYRVDPAIFAGAEESFKVTPPTESKIIGDFVPSLFALSFKALDEKREGAYHDVDVAVVAVSLLTKTVSAASGIPSFTRKAMPSALKQSWRKSTVNSSGPAVIISFTSLKSIISSSTIPMSPKSPARAPPFPNSIR